MGTAKEVTGIFADAAEEFLVGTDDIEDYNEL
jgi:hypothetical protein